MSECEHGKVRIASRLLYMATLEEPAEYEYQITCQLCGERLDEVPDGADETDGEWEFDYED